MGGQVPHTAASAGLKVFWFFSSEKNIFLLLRGALISTLARPKTLALPSPSAMGPSLSRFAVEGFFWGGLFVFFGGAFGAGAAVLAFGVEVAVDEFDDGHVRRVAVADARF